MDIEICKKCTYYCEEFLLNQGLCSYSFFSKENGYFEKCEYIKPDGLINGCPNFKINNKIKIGDKMRNDNFKTELRSYNNKKCRVLSVVTINCEDYETFKQVVEAVMPILEKEDVKECE